MKLGGHEVRGYVGVNGSSHSLRPVADSGQRLQPLPPVVTGALTGESASGSLTAPTASEVAPGPRDCPQCGVPMQKLPFFVYCIPCGTSIAVFADWEKRA